MLHVPARFAAILVAFAAVFVQAPTWQNAQMLLLGALLVSGQRTVCSILRIIGLRQDRHFVTYHRVLTVLSGTAALDQIAGAQFRRDLAGVERKAAIDQGGPCHAIHRRSDTG